MVWTPDTMLLDMSLAECEEHLRDAEIGRLGVIVDGHPAVFPVCHIYLDGAIAFPTNRGTKLDAALTWPFVAFEVDGVEPAEASGWSVMVTGQAEEVADEAERRRLADVRHAAWRTSRSLRWIRIVPGEITGRRIVASE